MEIVLNSYGVSLNRDNEAFVVTSADGRQRIPTDGITSILLSRGASLTSDAALLAIENEIEILFMDRSGDPLGRVWSHKYGSISTIRKGQLSFTQSHDAVKWIKSVLKRKLENQQAMLLMMAADDTSLVDHDIARIEGYKSKIMNIDGDMVGDVASSLRGWEGMSARIYFSALNQFIPEKLRFAERSQHPATDIMNALLNYGYGILYSHVESALIKAGIDPYIGVLHRDNYNRPVLVYDVIELYRIWIDYVVYSLVCQNVVSDDFYSTSEDGAVWLEQFGRRVLIQSANDYLAEIVEIKGVKRSRLTHISLQAQELAQNFKKY